MKKPTKPDQPIKVVNELQTVESNLGAANLFAAILEAVRATKADLEKETKSNDRTRDSTQHGDADSGQH